MSRWFVRLGLAWLTFCIAYLSLVVIVDPEHMVWGWIGRAIALAAVFTGGALTMDQLDSRRTSSSK